MLPLGWPLIGRPARELPTHSGRVWMSPARNATQRSTASISRRQFFPAGAGAPADSPYLGSIVSRLRPAERNIANYVWLIRCVGDPVFCAPNIGSGGHLGARFTPLFVGSANNHAAMASFQPPDELKPAAEPERLLGLRRLINAVNGQTATRVSPAFRDWDDLHRRAFELASGQGSR